MNIKYFCFLIFLSQGSFGQKVSDGIYFKTDSTNGIRSEEIISIKKDSIWIVQKKYGVNVPPGELFQNSEGELIYYKSILENGRKSGPIYLAYLMVMSCDTCPEFWKHTLKTEDSLDTEPEVLTTGKWDTIIKNNDTMYTIPQIIMESDKTDLNRVREFFFKVSKSGNIIMDGKLYRRKNKKN